MKLSINKHSALKSFRLLTYIFRSVYRATEGTVDGARTMDNVAPFSCLFTKCLPPRRAAIVFEMGGRERWSLLCFLFYFFPAKFRGSSLKILSTVQC